LAVSSFIHLTYGKVYCPVAIYSAVPIESYPMYSMFARGRGIGNAPKLRKLNQRCGEVSQSVNDLYKGQLTSAKRIRAQEENSI